MSAEQDEQDQIDEINNSFIQANSITLSKLKHPTNPKLTAVEMVPIFPDFEFWPNSLALATFDKSCLIWIWSESLYIIPNGFEPNKLVRIRYIVTC